MIVCIKLYLNVCQELPKIGIPVQGSDNSDCNGFRQLNIFWRDMRRRILHFFMCYSTCFVKLVLRYNYDLTSIFFGPNNTKNNKRVTYITTKHHTNWELPKYVISMSLNRRQWWGLIMILTILWYSGNFSPPSIINSVTCYLKIITNNLFSIDWSYSIYPQINDKQNPIVQ